MLTNLTRVPSFFSRQSARDTLCSTSSPSQSTRAKCTRFVHLVSLIPSTTNQSLRISCPTEPPCAPMFLFKTNCRSRTAPTSSTTCVSSTRSHPPPRSRATAPLPPSHRPLLQARESFRELETSTQTVCLDLTANIGSEKRNRKRLECQHVAKNRSWDIDIFTGVACSVSVFSFFFLALSFVRPCLLRGWFCCSA